MMLITALFVLFSFARCINVKSESMQQNPPSSYDKHYWREVAEAELKQTISTKLNDNVAKNVIFFLGDGMGISTVTAARIYEGQKKGGFAERGYLSFEKFPHSGLIKTYAVDRQVADSASTGTAYLSGSKTNKGVIGVDASVSRGNCSTLSEESIVHSLAKLFQDVGKSTGFVTSTRVTHATPANMFAHTPERDWECDQFIPEGCLNVKDIARQLVEDETGKNLKVIMGGGFQNLDSAAFGTTDDPIEYASCSRTDGRALWKEWLNEKRSQGKTAEFVRDATSLKAVDLEETEYLFGVFANSHVPYEYEKREKKLNVPTLAEMTESAIQVLQKDTEGYFLLVEGGRIDLAHHANQAKVALDETSAFNDAVTKAFDMTNQEDTLIIVTADHSHTLTITGYPKIGSPIAGLGDKDDEDLPYTTLMYTIGPGQNFTVENDKAVRANVTQEQATSWDYRQNSLVKRHSATHGGEDVSIYALGPMSHLFTAVHEQNYIHHAIAYTACVGKYKGNCRK